MTTKKPRQKYVHVEDQEQSALVDWADITRLEINGGHTIRIGDYLIAVPNGGNRSASVGARLKRQGVRAGYPDLILDVPRGKYHGARIEMKKPPRCYPTPGAMIRDIRDNQSARLRLLAKSGYFACVAFGQDEAKRLIVEYLQGTADYPLGYVVTHPMLGGGFLR